jgi:hypothetical protein
MIKLVERLFGTRKKQLDIPVVINSDIYYLSIHIDREKQEHIDKMNLFIKMLNEQNIVWETFISEPTLMTIYNQYRFNHFNVCVEVKYKDDLKQIHKDVYGF